MGAGTVGRWAGEKKSRIAALNPGLSKTFLESNSFIFPIGKPRLAQVGHLS